MEVKNISKLFFDWIITLKAICFESVLRCPYDCTKYYADLCDWRNGTHDEFLTIPHSIKATVIFLSVEELRSNDYYYFETDNVFLIDKENREHRVFSPCSNMSDRSCSYLCLTKDSNDSDEGLFLLSESIVEESFKSIRFYNPKNSDNYIDFTADELQDTIVDFSEYLSKHTAEINNKQLVSSQIDELLDKNIRYYEITRQLNDQGVIQKEIASLLIDRIKQL